MTTPRLRSTLQKIRDLVTLPLRAITLFEHDRWGLSSLRSERFYYVAKEVQGYTLDVGCGRKNWFIRHFLRGDGKGIDVYLYEGLTKENVVRDITHFPFPDESFDSVTIIAAINHIPRSLRDIELRECYRCLKAGGNIVVTMGLPWAELLVHRVIHWHDWLFGTNFDVDYERGMHEEEEYFLTDQQIRELLTKAGLREITKKVFWTQWGLNHLFVGWKK